MEKNETQIAIIGATQSGKTTLAAGLAKTSSPEFTVGFANQATSDYFQPRIAGIAAGHWPEGNIGEDKDLGLKINTPGGRSALISFKEYMGERMNDENYLEHIVGKPNGALILLSPGMGLLTDHMKREKLIGNLKGIVDYLKSNKCVAIAFVVTACDRLKTDLKDFAEEFGNCVAEVTNYLNTSGMDWKRFDVTITGELVDQQKPSIAVGDKNTARGPFVWIMDRVAGRKHMTAAKRVVGWLSGLALVVLAAFGAIRGVQYYSESADLKAREKMAAGIEERVTSAAQKKSESELKLATDDLAVLIASSKTLQCRFRCCEARRTNDVAKWADAYDDARVQYFSVSMDKRYDGRANNGSEENCAAFDTLLVEFAPVDSIKKTALTNRWTEIRPRIREGYDVECGNRFSRQLSELKQKEKDKGLLGSVRDFKNEVSKWTTDFVSSQNIRTNVLSGAELLIQSIEDELDLRAGNGLQAQINDLSNNAATKATQSALEELRQDIANWESYTMSGKIKKAELDKTFVNESPKWRMVNLNYSCETNAETIVHKVRSLNPNDSSLHSDDICDTLKTAYGFTNEWKKASANVLSVATNKICKVSSKFLSDFQSSFTNKWNIYGKKKPEICNDDKNFIEAALDLPNPDKPSEKLTTSFLRELEESLKDALARWRENQRKLANAYIKTLEGKSAEDAYGDYRRWFDLNSANPFVTNVDSVVVAKVEEFFDKYIEEVKIAFLQNEEAFNSAAGRDQAKKRYDEFKNICLAIAADCSRNPNGLSSSWCALFAKSCVDSGKIGSGMNKAFEQGLTVTKIDVKVTEDGSYNDYIGGKFSMSCLNYLIVGQELKQGAIEPFFVIDDFKDYGVKLRNSWQTLWNGTKRLSLNPWTYTAFFLKGSLDLSGTPEDAKGDGAIRMYPLCQNYARGSIEGTFRCKYLTWGGQEQFYACHVRIYCTFEGVDIFELFNKYRK